MPIPPHSQIHPGTSVSIILKADQASGRQIQGIVEDILTHGDHPRGVKVRLMDGQIGRVQRVVHASGGDAGRDQYQYSSTPAPQLQPQTYSDLSDLQQSYQQNQADTTSFPSGGPPGDNPWQQQPSQSQHSYTEHQPSGFRAPPRTDSASNLVPEGERGEQVEYLQSYEAAKSETEDDRNQATLQREFPGIDSSLIAAVYGDSKSLSATREMLQALGD